MTKSQSYKFDTKPLLFSGKGAFSRNLFLRNEPNFNSSKCIASTYSSVSYNVSQPKTKNGTNPNEPNFRQVASKPWRRRISKGITKLFREILAFLKHFFWEANPISKTRKSLQVLAVEVLTTIYALNSTKKANPIQTQSKPNYLLSTFYRSTLSGQRPAVLSSGKIFLLTLNPFKVILYA